MIEIEELITALYYLSYRAEISHNEKDNIFIGQVVNIENEIITFSGDSTKELKLAFKTAIDEYLSDCEKSHKKPQEPLIEEIFLSFKDDPFVWTYYAKRAENYFGTNVVNSKGDFVKEYPPSYDSSELSEEYDNKRKQHEEQIRQSNDKIRLDIAVKELTNDEKRQKNIRDYYRKVEGIYKEKIGTNLWVKAGEFYLWIWKTYEDLQDKIPEKYKLLEPLYFVGSRCGRTAPMPLTEIEFLRERIRQLETQNKYLKSSAENWDKFIKTRKNNPRKSPEFDDNDLW